MDRAEVAGDQKDDIVEIGVVVEARDPRLIRRAGVGSRCEREEDRNQSKANEPQSDFPIYHCHCHPTATKGQGGTVAPLPRTIWHCQPNAHREKCGNRAGRL